MKLYHYTNEEGNIGIKQDGCIHQSSDGRCGRGVYLNDLDPNTTDRDDVAKSNYTGGAIRHRDKADHCFPVNIPDWDSALMHYKGNTWVYKKDIPSSMIEWSESGHVSKFAVEMVVAAAAIGAIGAGIKLYSARQKQAEIDRAEEKIRLTKRTVALLEGGRKDLKVEHCHILACCEPSNCILSSRNVEVDIEQYLIAFRRSRMPGYFFFAWFFRFVMQVFVLFCCRRAPF